MKTVLLIVMLWLPVSIWCQSAISGTVITNDNKPLLRASIFIPNTTVGVYTNEEGKFTLANLPAGDFKFAVSYVGYELTLVSVPVSWRSKTYVIKMQPEDNELKAVVLTNYDARGWKKWGDIFTSAFIGTSAYAGNCTIKNKENIQFYYSDATKQLQAFSDTPLVIENKSLGYLLTINLVDFTYNLSTKFVDYQTYARYEEMKGTDKEMKSWKKNRLKVYSYSLMRFMRALYADNLKNEGYQLHIIKRKENKEKQRIQALYKQQFNRIKDSLGVNKNATDINRLIERTFARDSLKYYKKVLAQDDEAIGMDEKRIRFEDIAEQKDSSTVVLHFTDCLQVIYTKTKEPEEYFFYKNGWMKNSDATGVVLNASIPHDDPVTELTLPQGIPVEIKENGYFSNVDLLINGFWGWWEKIATKLPNEYQP